MIHASESQIILLFSHIEKYSRMRASVSKQWKWWKCWLLVWLVTYSPGALANDIYTRTYSFLLVILLLLWHFWTSQILQLNSKASSIIDIISSVDCDFFDCFPDILNTQGKSFFTVCHQSLDTIACAIQVFLYLATVLSVSLSGSVDRETEFSPEAGHHTK